MFLLGRYNWWTPRWLGGKDNFAADREAADRQARAIPQLPLLARENREFLRRAVRFLAGQGISQFLDIGSGLPTNENVHEVAQRANPDARVVYADIDPVVVNHAQALLSGQRVAAVRGDLTLVEPGLTDIWAWRPDGDTVTTTTEFLRILGGVARKD
jgi:hypothetical protein